MKKVVIAGGTGFIGTYLTKRFEESGYNALIVSREAKHVSWKPVELTEAFEGAELIVNLAGKNINCRHNALNRKAIIDSRVSTTMWIGNAIEACKTPPKLWVNASASGVYKPSLEKTMTEDEPELGSDFLADVVREWEKTFFGFQLQETRQVALRTTVVLGRNGGALKPLMLLSCFGLGGKQASGRQLFSWIHVEDYFRILIFLLENKTLNDVVNCTSPTPLTNSEFMRSLRKTLKMPIGIPAPEFAIRLVARLIGTEPELILNSSNVIPKRLLEAGFRFRFPSLEFALDDLLHTN
ncbi:MAG TPA: TIGR01777 family oxidoreductase [Paludibacter sp.]|nr:TIGR01777 family oxidoreductase [Paludibacter sp.]